jgi:hypothetical protein
MWEGRILRKKYGPVTQQGVWKTELTKKEGIT